MKSLLKQLLLWLMTLLLLPFLLVYWLLKPFCHRDALFAGFSQLLSLVPGLTGSYLRVAAYRLLMQHCGQDCYIGFGVLFSQQGTELGDGVYLGPQCNIGLCHIGADTLLGSGVHILSGKNQHQFADPTLPFKEQGGVFEKVSIGANCWIGNGAIVMASIGEGCIIGAGAVVTQPLPPGVIAAGNPAKVLRAVYPDAGQQDT